MHRDIAPRNIFYSRNELKQLVFKIGDFGLCCYLEKSDRTAVPIKNSMHTPDDARLTYQFDVFSIGVVMFGAMRHEVVDCEQDFYERETLRAHLAAMRGGPFAELVPIVEKMVAESAIDRFNAIQALRALCQVDTSSESIVRFPFQCCLQKWT